MFFNTHEFVFFFLPVTYGGFLLLRNAVGHLAAQGWLIAASLIFYWSLDGDHVIVLAISIVATYGLSYLIVRWRGTADRWAFAALCAGVLSHILALGYFKYAGAWLNSGTPIAVPLGISFFSIQQVAYLISTYNEDHHHPPLAAYALFAGFFPYVVAGPILTKKDVLRQCEQPSPPLAELALPAMTLFSLGLFKKTAIADNIAPFVDRIFQVADHGEALSVFDAWSGALLYTLQIYFDFSGYSDMAAGLAGLFGIRIARNFHSPYQACSIMEFWRRWHMSMTRFFTNFVYLPLAVAAMRLIVRRRIRGPAQVLLMQIGPLVATFLLVGVWHGAGSNFLAFGLMMGVALTVNHAWRRSGLPLPPRIGGWLLTMTVVVTGMVLDRAADLDAAATVLRSMAGLGGTDLVLLEQATVVPWLIGLGAIVLLAPNTHEIMARHPVVLDEAWEPGPRWWRWLKWSYRDWGVVYASLVFCIALLSISKAANFIYYQF